MVRMLVLIQSRLIDTLPTFHRSMAQSFICFFCYLFYRFSLGFCARNFESDTASAQTRGKILRPGKDT